MRELHLFAGAGGGILGGLLLGHIPVCAVEINQYCKDVLRARQRDGVIPSFPIFDDVRTFDGKQWRGRVDAVCGGFPCQDISTSGSSRLGIAGPKSGLWSEMVRIIRDISPSRIFVENSPALTFRGLDRVLQDLASLGFDARWGVFSAADVGARHERARIWILGKNRNSDKECASTELPFHFGRANPEPLRIMQKRWWSSEERMDRGTDGMATRLERLGALGNGQVPAVAAMAWKILDIWN